MNLPQLPLDKAMHIIYGGAIFLCVFVVGILMALPYPRYVALGSVVLAAVGKEVSDYVINRRLSTPTHGVEFLDALATVCGGLVPFVAVLVDPA